MNKFLAVAFFASVALTGFGEAQAMPIAPVGAGSERGGDPGFRRLRVWLASRALWRLPPAL